MTARKNRPDKHRPTAKPQLPDSGALVFKPLSYEAALLEDDSVLDLRTATERLGPLSKQAHVYLIEHFNADRYKIREKCPRGLWLTIIEHAEALGRQLCVSELKQVIALHANTLEEHQRKLMELRSQVGGKPELHIVEKKARVKMPQRCGFGNDCFNAVGPDEAGFALKKGGEKPTGFCSQHRELLLAKNPAIVFRTIAQIEAELEATRKAREDEKLAEDLASQF